VQALHGKVDRNIVLHRVLRTLPLAVCGVSAVKGKVELLLSSAQAFKFERVVPVLALYWNFCASMKASATKRRHQSSGHHLHADDPGNLRAGSPTTAKEHALRAQARFAAAVRQLVSSSEPA